jgi:signal transduction histidine kinase/response regulator RpfG family c-di-GMP phosphodiesterase
MVVLSYLFTRNIIKKHLNQNTESVFTNMAIILVLLGTALSAVLIFLLIRVDRARNKSDIENKHKSSFLANVSHEIRTPMNAIIGMTDLLNYEPLNKRQMGFVDDIRMSARSLLAIINDILDMSKIEAGNLTLNPISYDFHFFLDNICSMFRYITQKKGIEFKYETEGSLPRYLYGDDIRLKQVLINICGNAVKYTDKGYVKFKVTYFENRLLFEIKDTGIGMRKEDLPKLFSTFQRLDTEKNRSIIGTGLGLSISKVFVEMMGGKIVADSEYEQGSVFMILIPAVLGKKEEVKSNKNILEKETLIAADAKILIVDDNEFNIKVAEGLLGLFKITPQKALSGREAIELAKNNDYDLIFMDHMMPEMDGVEATGIIRKLGDKHKKTPIIALTANALQGAREMFLSNGFDDFVSKPIDIREMFRILKEWLPAEKIEIKEAVTLTTYNENDANSEFISALNKIGEINIEIGLEQVSGMENMYQETLVNFNKKLVNDCANMYNKLNYGDINEFEISIHSMKSALATIGAVNLAETALKLETAAKNKDINFCAQKFPAFRNQLLKLNKDLSAILPENTESENKQKNGDTSYLKEQIEKAFDAASEFDSDAGFNIINDLLVYDFGEKINKLLKDAAAAFNNFNYDLSAALLNKIKANL